VCQSGDASLTGEEAKRGRFAYRGRQSGDASLTWEEAKRGRFAYLGGGKARTLRSRRIHDPLRTSRTNAGAFTTNSRVSLLGPVVFGTKNELKSSRI
jgi:hypothetical protein